MTSQAKRETLVTEIKKIRKVIKRKHKALTGKAIIEQQELEKQFEPITQPLKKLVNFSDLLKDTGVKMDDVETRVRKVKRRQNAVEISPTKVPKIESLPNVLKMNTDEGETEIYESEPTLSEVLSSPEGRNRANLYIDKSFTGELVKLYMHKFIENKNKEIDHKIDFILKKIIR